jgi:hypothetical protein
MIGLMHAIVFAQGFDLPGKVALRVPALTLAW